MMCVLMGVRDGDALARACDLGVAMQLTNIARDVGEDAREGRLYLPKDWLTEAGIAPAQFLKNSEPNKAIRVMVKRLIIEANRLYYRSEAGIAALPLPCRPGIFAARHIYAGIGGRVQAQGFDTISTRARTSKTQKVGWLLQSALRAGVTCLMPKSAVLYAPALPEVRFLVDAAAEGRAPDRLDSLFDALATLELRKRQDLLAREGGIKA
jgi:phytoene synthase